MKQIALSVPHGTFPARRGDHVRIRLVDITGLDTLDALVIALDLGCGATDSVVLRYDETLLPPHVERLSACNVFGFLPLCPCCSARPCFELVAPNAEVQVGTTLYAGDVAGPFRLAAIKVYSPHPAPKPLGFNVLIGGEALFPEPIITATGKLTISRNVFAAAFAPGQVPPDSRVDLVVTSGPTTIYYDEPWRGLSLCLIGEYQP